MTSIIDKKTDPAFKATASTFIRVSERYDPGLMSKFIATYKQLPCLWNKNSPGYRVWKTKVRALNKLLEIVKDEYPDATISTVERKISSLRACHRKERHRIEVETDESKKEPKLWYYNQLSFLNSEGAMRLCYVDKKKQSKDKDGQKERNLSFQRHASKNKNKIKIGGKNGTKNVRKINIKKEPSDGMPSDEQRYEEAPDEYEQSLDPSDYTMETNIVEVDANKPYSYEEDPKAKRHCTEIDDEYDAIGVNVAAKLRNLPQNMRILAEKLINDVLYQAQLSALNSTSVISTPVQFKQDPIS